MPQITIMLTIQEKIALLKIAKQEARDPKQQAYVILRDELKKRGVLEDESSDMQDEFKQTSE